MYKIVTVCVNGVGTSIMAKKLVSDSIKDLGFNIKDIIIDETSMSRINSVSCDLIVTTMGLSSRIPSKIKESIGVITVMNMISGREQMKKALKPYLDKAAEANLVSKI